MKPFTPLFPANISAATEPSERDASFLAGGTTLLDLMKIGVLEPQRIVIVSKLLDRDIRVEDSQVIIGAGVTMSSLAQHETIEKLPVVRQALIQAASPQIRNMATIGGNLLQQTRCPYFRHTEWACNRREPDSGCSAQDDSADNKMLAVLGTSKACIANYPGDLAVALVCLDASLELRLNEDRRQVPLKDFYRLPDDHPEHQTQLRVGELITHIRIPLSDAASNSYYIKVRERSSYAFALASAAISLQLSGKGPTATIKTCSLALGGLASIPWRLTKVEEFLKSKLASDEHFEQAAEMALENAVTFKNNKFKVELGKRTLVQGLKTLRDEGPLSDSRLWEIQHGREQPGSQDNE